MARSLALAVGLAFAAFSLALPARAESATEAVKSANEKVRSALDAYNKAQPDARAEAKKGVRAAVESLIDFERLIESAAGAHWKSMSHAEKKRFGDALRGVMESSYLGKMRDQGNVDVNKVTTDYAGEEPAEGGHTLVKTVLHSGDDTAHVDYVLSKEKHGWRAVDVLTEGTSLADTYREQIATLWPKGGFDKVVERLEKKRKSLEAKEDAGAGSTQ